MAGMIDCMVSSLRFNAMLDVGCLIVDATELEMEGSMIFELDKTSGGLCNNDS